ncbi:hypothetical protein AB9P05_04450 [Roseivirga sp. BDSF3-8]|uniref:hypothetical protein n=1 Tax=Roseivirga sp. BDSF3-8 TaxID=3241598 RepID=UPI003531CC64
MDIIQIILTAIIGIVGLLPDTFSKNTRSDNKGYRIRIITILILLIALIANSSIEYRKREKAESEKALEKAKGKDLKLFESEASDLMHTVSANLSQIHTAYSMAESRENIIGTLHEHKVMIEEDTLDIYYEKDLKEVEEDIQEEEAGLLVSRNIINKYKTTNTVIEDIELFLELTDERYKNEIISGYHTFINLLDDGPQKNNTAIIKQQTEIYELMKQSYKEQYKKKILD